MKVLVIAPHPDDEVLGVGGTIAKRAENGDEVYVCVVTKGCPPIFDPEFIEQGRGECLKADGVLGVKETIFLDFPAVMLEEVQRYILNSRILEVINTLMPEEVFIPHRGDMQIDHKIIVDACMVALRPKYKNGVKRIFAYETMSETGWDIPNVVNEFIPNVYIDITKYLKKKTEALCCFESQLATFPNARSVRAIEALASYRGAMVSMEAAEAFMLIRGLM